MTTRNAIVPEFFRGLFRRQACRRVQSPPLHWEMVRRRLQAVRIRPGNRQAGIKISDGRSTVRHSPNREA